MPRITIELIRKRVEHNEGEIHSVEELALHQEKLERLENLDRWCKKLKILLLHNNLIKKIENVSKLKELEYLNLALNNIERVENLEGCESLRKLDLTLNFIGEITSVLQLRQNELLENLYLTGNPCTDFPGYRQFVVNALPNLKSLDGTEISMTERLIARQSAKEIQGGILRAEYNYKVRREQERNEFQPAELPDDPKNDDDYWNKIAPNTPEVRTEMSLRALRLEEKSEKAKSSLNPVSKGSEKQAISRFYPDGRPKNMNHAKIPFLLDDDAENNTLVLDLAVPKYMDTSLIEADVQPTYATFVIKGKVFQIVLPEEVKPDSSVAQRSQTTGHLVVRMPKLHESAVLLGTRAQSCHKNRTGDATTSVLAHHHQQDNNSPDWRNIVRSQEGEDDAAFKGFPPNTSNHCSFGMEKSEDFTDNPDVPPLI